MAQAQLSRAPFLFRVVSGDRFIIRFGSGMRERHDYFACYYFTVMYYTDQLT
jgi:hypothetical protein